MYKEIIRPLLDRLDSETFHNIARESLHLAELTPLTLKLVGLFADGHKRFADKRLRTVLGGVEFENPLIVGAGWDKSGRALMGLWQLGFAGVEVGSVLEYRQPGNPKPRQFMVSPGVAINWLGFNSPGMDVVAKNLGRYEGAPVRVGISIGMNRDVPHDDSPEAHAVVAKRLYGYADYFAINVSSPNTPGLRMLHEKGRKRDIIRAVNEAMEGEGGRKPLFVKIAPELGFKEVDDILEVAVEHSITGIIAANTADVPGMKAKYGEKWRGQPGGLSGDDEDYRKMTTEKVAHIYRQAGDKLEIIGVGGIKDAGTALEKIRAGAKAVQLVTAIRGEGTAVAGKINRGIVEFMEREGVGSLDELVGVDAGK
ncbi:MAG: quinone-dependent dihydroorotate dehydrogenase [Thermodesulfobacteriota bacterium]